MEKQISCCIFYTDKKRFLAVHPTNHNKDYWDLPKGVNNDNEPFIKTAIREFKEEVGISLNENQLRYIGKFLLHKTKDIILYSCVVPVLPSINTMKCVSTFKLKGTDTKEVDEYKYFTIQEFYKIRKELHKCYSKILEKINVELD